MPTQIYDPGGIDLQKNNPEDTGRNISELDDDTDDEWIANIEQHDTDYVDCQLLFDTEINRHFSTYSDPIISSISRIISDPQTRISPMHKSAVIYGSQGQVAEIRSVLLDTGAIHQSYLSYRLYEDLRQKNILTTLSDTRSKRVVKLADHDTIKKIYGSITIDIEFMDSLRMKHRHKIKVDVFDMLGEVDIILGQPHLFSVFNPLLIDSIRQACYIPSVSHIQSTSPFEEENDALHAGEEGKVASTDTYENGTHRRPWTSILEVAKEESELYDPVTFQHALYNLQTSTDERLEEYLQKIGSRVDKRFARETDIINLLKDTGKDIFVPSNWEGIKGVLVDLHWKPNVPESMRPKIIPINPRLYATAKNEFDRLMSYYLEFCDSPWASPLVIAPKATKPFIRFCGNYVKINKFIETPTWPVPRVLHELEKAKNARVFVDLDMTNSFHQFALSENSSKKLSIATPWGQVRPKFMPEGIPPASLILHDTMKTMFSDFEEWLIVIFDNILILAQDFQDAFEKTKLVFLRCKQRNVFLKLEKSRFGDDTAKFFGYEVGKGEYKLTPDRLQAIQEIPFPSKVKEMQSFLGTLNFTSPFIPNFAMFSGPMSEMIKDSFDWKDKKKIEEKKKLFDEFKATILRALSLRLPDYELEWTLRTDASDYGIGWVLFQTTKEGVEEPLFCKSQVLTEQAIKWTTIEKEGFAIYRAVQSLDYLLRAKEFTIETDHNNLVYMEKSIVPKIQRMVAYLQSFDIKAIKHIAGTKNKVADYFSRLWDPRDLKQQDADSSKQIDHIANIDEAEIKPSDEVLTPKEMFAAVHGGRRGHWGIKTTYEKMNREFPGHRVSLKAVTEMVESCPTCQKDRMGMTFTVKPLIKTHKVSRNRILIGADLLSVAPDKNGYACITVITNFYTKRCRLFKQKDKSAESLANSIMLYVTQHGLFDEIRTDPGSDYTSEVMDLLLKYLGMKHSFTIVNNPKGSNVEGTNSQVMRHLRAIAMDCRVKDRWSDDDVLPIVEYLINSTYNREAGGIPLILDTGNLDEIYLTLPDNISSLPQKGKAAAYVKALRDNLLNLRKIVTEHHEKLDTERRTPEGEQEMYQPGDYVLAKTGEKNHKLESKFQGPFEVIQHSGNNVTVKHLAHKETRTLETPVLKHYIGNEADAFKAALYDKDQFVVTKISNYRGDPEYRSTMEYMVHFEDGSISWRKHEPDITTTKAFEEFITRPDLPQLYILTQNADFARSMIKAWDRIRIDPLLANTTAYLDLRSWGLFYNTLEIPDKDIRTFMVPVKLGKINTVKVKKTSNITTDTIDMFIPLLNEEYVGKYAIKNSFLRQWRHSVPPINTEIIDESFVEAFPTILAKK